MRIRPGKHQRSSGAAILVVMALLFILSMIVLANSATLRNLQQELRLIDQQQQQRYEPSPSH